MPDMHTQAALSVFSLDINFLMPQNIYQMRSRSLKLALTFLNIFSTHRDVF